MKLIDQNYKIMTFNPEQDIRDICTGYCLCYKTPMPKTFEDQCAFVRKHRNHESPLEHSRLSVILYTNRGISHEQVRHRIASYSQESTRYCNYSNGRFNNEITYISDPSIEEVYPLAPIYEYLEKQYMLMLEAGLKPEQARAILPTGLKTEVLVTANFREWRHIFEERCSKVAHYQIREVMTKLYDEVNSVLPCVFDDIDIYRG